MSLEDSNPSLWHKVRCTIKVKWSLTKVALQSRKWCPPIREHFIRNPTPMPSPSQVSKSQSRGMILYKVRSKVFHLVWESRNLWNLESDQLEKWKNMTIWWFSSSTYNCNHLARHLPAPSTRFSGHEIEQIAAATIRSTYKSRCNGLYNLAWFPTCTVSTS